MPIYVPGNSNGTTVRSMAGTALSLLLVPIAWTLVRSITLGHLTGSDWFSFMSSCQYLEMLGGAQLLLLKAAMLTAVGVPVLISVYERRILLHVLRAFVPVTILLAAFFLTASSSNKLVGGGIAAVVDLAVLAHWDRESRRNYENTFSVFLMAVPLALSVLCVVILRMSSSYDAGILHMETYLLAQYGAFWAFRSLSSAGGKPGCGLFGFLSDLRYGCFDDVDNTADRVILTAAALVSAAVCLASLVVLLRFLWPLITFSFGVLRSL